MKRWSTDDRLDLHLMLHLIILHAVMPRVVRGGRIGWLCTLDAVQACTRHRAVVEFRFGAPRRRGFTHKIDVNAIRVTQ